MYGGPIRFFFSKNMVPQSNFLDEKKKNNVSIKKEGWKKQTMVFYFLDVIYPCVNVLSENDKDNDNTEDEVEENTQGKAEEEAIKRNEEKEEKPDKDTVDDESDFSIKRRPRSNTIISQIVISF